jgi:hypothetical protein
MNAPLFELDRPGMQAAVNSYKPGSGLAWQTLFPLKYTPKFDLKGIEGDEGIPVTADRVAFNTKAPLKTRRTVGSWSGKLGKIAVSRDKDETQINEYEDLRVIAAANTEDTATARYLVDMVYDDVDFCNKAMDYRVELDALRIGSSGKQILSKKLDGEMATEDTINFNVPAENFIGAAVAWNDAANADGLKDIANGQEIIAKKGLRKPMYAIMEKSKFQQLRAQKSVARRLFPSTTDLSLVTTEMVTLERINNYMRQEGYPQILYIDSYVTVEQKDGTQETLKPWNEKVVTLSPTIQLGWTYWKRVPMAKNTEAYQVYGSFYKLTVYSDVNPQTETTLAEAYVQPGLINRASLVFINTTKSTWSNGN